MFFHKFFLKWTAQSTSKGICKRRNSRLYREVMPPNDSSVCCLKHAWIIFILPLTRPGEPRKMFDGCLQSRYDPTSSGIGTYCGLRVPPSPPILPYPPQSPPLLPHSPINLSCKKNLSFGEKIYTFLYYLINSFTLNLLHLLLFILSIKKKKKKQAMTSS